MSNFRDTGRLILVLAVALLAGGCPTDEPTDVTRSRWFEDGRNKVMAGKFPEAAESFNKVLRTRPDSAPTHWELGLLNADHLDKPALAIYHFEQFKTISPSDTRARIAEEKIISCKKLIADEMPQLNIDQVSHQLIVERNSLKRENEILKNEREALRLQNEKLLASIAKLEGRPPPAPAPTTAVTSNTGSRSPTRGARTATPTQPVYDHPTTHTVASGDNFYRIATRYNIKPSALQAANPSVNPKRMQIGQVIKLPPPSR